MNRFYIVFTILFVLGISAYSQEKITTKFYSLQIPEKTSTKVFDTSHEELANVDVYQFNVDEKPKYILYLMSNKTKDGAIKVNLENYKNFLFDLGDINILDVENFDKKIKINFTYNNKNNINGIIYAYIKNDILNRFVFLLPNDSAKKTFGAEIDKMIENLMEVKSNW
jgi:hypothetical protein